MAPSHMDFGGEFERVDFSSRRDMMLGIAEDDEDTDGSHTYQCQHRRRLASGVAMGAIVAIIVALACTVMHMQSSVNTAQRTKGPSSGQISLAAQSCSDQPDPYMVQNGYTCKSWTWMYKNRCNAPVWVNQYRDGWIASKFCQQSCWANGNGYDGDDCGAQADSITPARKPASTPAPLAPSTTPPTQQKTEMEAGAQCADAVNVTGAESVQSMRMGLYTKAHVNATPEDGKFPIYVNNKSQYLYFWQPSRLWAVGSDFRKGMSGIVALTSASCPDKVKKWQVYAKGKFHTDYVVTVSEVNVHSKLATTTLVPTSSATLPATPAPTVAPSSTSSASTAIVPTPATPAPTVAPACPEAVVLLGAEAIQSTRMGSYSRVNITPTPKQNGRPLYKHSNGQYLYYWAPLKKWLINDAYTSGMAGIASTDDAAWCPTSASGWQAWDGRSLTDRHRITISVKKSNTSGTGRLRQLLRRPHSTEQEVDVKETESRLLDRATSSNITSLPSSRPGSKANAKESTLRAGIRISDIEDRKKGNGTSEKPTTTWTWTSTHTTATLPPPRVQGAGDLLEFYVYRATAQGALGRYPFGNLNVANMDGVMWYLLNEVCTQYSAPGSMACPRKFNISEIHRFKVRMRATEELVQESMNFGVRFAYDFGHCIGRCFSGNMCTSTEDCDWHYNKYGYVVGCNRFSDGTVFPDEPTQAPGGIWLSLPLGGRCDYPTGAHNCTWSAEWHGVITLQELEMKQAGGHCCNGVCTSFWDDVELKNVGSTTWRSQQALWAFRQKYPQWPYDLPVTPCDFQSYKWYQQDGWPRVDPWADGGNKIFFKLK